MGARRPRLPLRAHDRAGVMRRLRRFWNSWQWALGLAAGAIGGFALAKISAAVDYPLFDALVLALPILIGGAILLKRW
jgi:hypothetical protein